LISEKFDKDCKQENILSKKAFSVVQACVSVIIMIGHTSALLIALIKSACPLGSRVDCSDGWRGSCGSASLSL